MSSRAWLEQRFLHPVVMVAASPDADVIALRNGVDTVQLLRPFSTCTETVYVRVADRSDVTAVRQFGARLSRPENIREMDSKSRTEFFTSFLRSISESELAYGEELDVALDAVLSQPSSVDPVLDGTMSSLLLQRSYPNWLQRFCTDYITMVRCSYFDTADHPAACLIVVGSHVEPQVMLDAVRLQEQRVRPFRDGMPCMDDDILSYIVVIHDLQRGPPLERIVQSFGALQQRVSPQRCALLRINGVATPESSKPLDGSRWVSANPSIEGAASVGTSGGPQAGDQRGGAVGGVTLTFGCWDDDPKRPKVVGCCLTQANVDELQTCMTQFLATALVPHLDRKLKHLAASINEKRQTTLSKVAAWFRKDDAKPKAECWVTSLDGSPPKYMFTALEMQMRRAGDICMVFREFDTASNYFRMCRQELQSTLVQRDFNKYLIAAAQEGIGLCLYFQGKLPLPSGGRGAPECRLETARDEYSRSAVHSYALRSSLMLYLICRGRTPPSNDRSSAVIQQVIRAGVVANNKLYAAVMHELCAVTCLFTNPPVHAMESDSELATVADDYAVKCRLREYARCMMMAGSAYVDNAVPLPAMGLRCYLRAYRVYRRRASCSGTSRPHVHEHIYTILSHLYNKLNQPQRAIAFITSAVAEGAPAFSNRLTASQNTSLFLRRLGAVMQLRAQSECPHMPLPVVFGSKAQLIIPRCHADEHTITEESLSVDAAEREWKVLEEGLRSHYHERTPCTVPKYFADGGQGRRGSTVLASTHRSGVVPVGEAAVVRLEVDNPTGATLQMDQIAFIVLEVSKLPQPQPDETVKHRSLRLDDALALAQRIPASDAPSVCIPPCGPTVLHFSFRPQTEGEHLILGLSWSVEGISGRYVFQIGADWPQRWNPKVIEAPTSDGARVEDRMLAVLEGMPAVSTMQLAHPSNLSIQAVSPQALLELDIDPPLPMAMRDGQVHRAVLRLRNISDSVAATHVTIQRSPANYHLSYFPSFSAAHNELSAERPLIVSDVIDPKSQLEMPIVFRAQLAPVARKSNLRCMNNFPLLVGYAPRDMRGEGVSGSPTSTSSPQQGSPCTSSPFAQHVRLCRWLRRVAVRPSITIDATVTPHPSLGAVVSAQARTAAPRSEAPMTLCRASVIAASSWPVQASLLAAASLTEDGGIGCQLSSDRPTVALAIGITPSPPNEQTQSPSDRTQLVEHSCLAVSSVVRSTSKAAQVEGALVGGEGGDTQRRLVDDPAMRFFCKHHTVGEGSLGAYEQRDAGDFAFYLDKAGGKSADEVAAERRRQAETDQFGQSLTPLPPMAIAVAWVADEEGNGGPVGVHFLIMDVLGALHAYASAGPNRRAVELMCVSTVAGIPTEASGGLCAAFAELRSVDSARGAVLCSMSVPPVTCSSAMRPHVACAQVTLRVHSWSPLPLRMEVTSRSPAEGRSTPVVFTGRTRRKFILMPLESVEVADLTADCHTPGLVNVNGIRVQAAACRFLPPSSENAAHQPSHCMKNGALPPTTATLLDHTIQRKLAVLGVKTPLMTLVQFVAPTGLTVGCAAPLALPSTMAESFPPSRLATDANNVSSAPVGVSSQPIRRARGTSLRGQAAVTLGGSTSSHLTAMRNSHRDAEDAVKWSVTDSCGEFVQRQACDAQALLPTHASTTADDDTLSIANALGDGAELLTSLAASPQMPEGPLDRLLDDDVPVAVEREDTLPVAGPYEGPVEAVMATSPSSRSSSSISSCGSEHLPDTVGDHNDGAARGSSYLGHHDEEEVATPLGGRLLSGVTPPHLATDDVNSGCTIPYPSTPLS